MFVIESSAVPEWRNLQKWWCPTSINVNCPYCAMKGAFVPENVFYDAPRKTLSSTAKCPSCWKSVSIWIIEPGPADDSSTKGNGTLTMFPKPTSQRQPLINAATLMPQRVNKAYQDSLGVYNAGVWGATTTQVRRTLEGILADLLPDDKRHGTLATQIKALTGAVDLTKPLITLADGLREGGNLGAHFDLDKEPDQRTAEAMLDLIEYLIEYVYTLPEMIEELHTRLSSLDNSAPT